jgi:hypothetical protein
VLLSVLFLMFGRHCDHLKHQDLPFQWHSVTRAVESGHKTSDSDSLIFKSLNPTPTPS